MPLAIALIILALPPHATPAAAQIPVPIEKDLDLTAGQLIGRLRKATRGIIDNSGRSRAFATTAVAGLVELADQLDAAFTNLLDTPLNQLHESMEAQVERGITALILSEDLATSMRTCVREDVRVLLEAFEENTRRALRDTRTWSGGSPRVLRAGLAGDVVFGIRTGVAQTVSFEGINLDSHPCGPASATLKIPGRAPIELAASTHGDRGVSIPIPPIERPGVYDISIRVRRKKLLFFCRSSTAEASIAVLPAAPFRIRYAISTTRSFVQQIVWNAGELKQGNGRCDRDTTASSLFRLPEGWTYASHNWIVFLDSGSVKEKEEVRDNAVYIQYRVPGRSGPFCTGPVKLIHGKMEIVGARTATAAGPSMDVAYPRTLSFGESVTLPVDVDPGEGSSIAGWTIDVRFVYPDGSVHAIPAMAGIGPLNGGEAGGGSFSWVPEDRDLTITAPGQTCQPLKGNR